MCMEVWEGRKRGVCTAESTSRARHTWMIHACRPRVMQSSTTPLIDTQTILSTRVYEPDCSLHVCITSHVHDATGAIHVNVATEDGKTITVQVCMSAVLCLMHVSLRLCLDVC